MASRPTRFVIVFAACFLFAYASLLTPPARAADTRISNSLVGLSEKLILTFGGHAFATGTVLRSPVNGFAVEMQDGCNGVYVTILLWSAILAFPASWKMRGLGLAAGTFLIQAINIVRFISLFYLGQYSMPWFDFAHGYLWESLLMLDTMILYGVWVSRVSPRGAASHAGR